MDSNQIKKAHHKRTINQPKEIKPALNYKIF